MSCNETRVAFFSALLGTEKWSHDQILALIRPILGEPREIEEAWDKSVHYFSYDKPPRGKRFYNDQEGVTTVVKSTDRSGIWFIRHTLFHAYGDSDIVFNSDLVSLAKIQAELKSKFTGIICGPWVLRAHTWYNGVDEYSLRLGEGGVYVWE